MGFSCLERSLYQNRFSSGSIMISGILNNTVPEIYSLSLYAYIHHDPRRCSIQNITCVADSLSMMTLGGQC